MSNFDLIQLLKSDDEGERKTAAEALGKLGQAEAVPVLIEALEQTESITEAISITDAFRRLRNPQAVPALFSLVERSGKWKTSLSAAYAVQHLRNQIAEALGSIADKDALIERLHHPDERVRRVAAEALGSIRII